jgi:tetratricopeptide (TPR) repeat protein
MVGPATLLLSVVLLSTCGNACQRAAHKMIQPFRETAAEWDLRTAHDRLARSDMPGAEAALRQAVAHDPHNGTAHAELARLLHARGDLVGAADHGREAVKAEPANLQYALALGDVLKRRAELSTERQVLLQAAARTYAHARWLDPTNVEALIGMGRCLRLLGEHDAAAEILRTASGMAPRNAGTYLELAAVWHTIGNHADALTAYDRVLELDPENLTALNAAGILNLRLSQSGELKPDSTRSLPAQPGPSNLPQRASTDSSAPIAYQRALALFGKSLKLDPAQPRIRALLQSLEPPVSPLATGPDSTDSP